MTLQELEALTGIGRNLAAGFATLCCIVPSSLLLAVSSILRIRVSMHKQDNN